MTKNIPQTKKRLVPDIARPGTSPPQDNSKSIIVSNRPVIQDPMVNSNTLPTNQELIEKKIAPPSATRLIINPIDSPDRPKTPVSEGISLVQKINKASLAESSTSVSVNSPPKTSSVDSPISQDLDNKLAKMTNNVDVSYKINNVTNLPLDHTTQSQRPNITSQPENNPSLAQSLNDKVKPTLEEEILEQQKKDEHLQMLINTKKYFLPINIISKKRKHKIVIILIFVFTILFLLGLDVVYFSGKIVF